ISVPAYLPYNTLSPTFTVRGSSGLPVPTATIVPWEGFSLAVSGMYNPEAVFSSAGAASTTTLSPIGLMFIAIIYLFFYFFFILFNYCFRPITYHQLCQRAKAGF